MQFAANSIEVWNGTMADLSQPLSLDGGEVHVWILPLDPFLYGVADFRAILAPDEAARANRFASSKDRRRFAMGRALLRLVLSLYLNKPPEELRFAYGSYGKPYLVGERSLDRLCFNVSHRMDLELCAVALGRRVGVDLERVRTDMPVQLLAQQFFAPSESAMLCALPTALQVAGFFNCWTRKEAYLKARGNGLSMPLDEFDVSLAPGAPPALLSARSDPGEVNRWAMYDLPVGPDWAAALVVEGQGCRVELRRFPFSIH